MCMKKNYVVTVGTRSRITVPYDCWMDANCKNLTLRYNVNRFPQFTWKWTEMKGMQKSMSYRVTVPFDCGMKLNLIPDAKHKQIIVEAA